MALGVFLIVLGLAAIGAPFLAGVAVTVLLGWLVLLAGITHLSYAWDGRERRVTPWQLLIGMAYLAAGSYLILHPAAGMAALTLVLAVYIAVEGVLELVAFSRLRHSGAALFFLIDGVVSILLASLIFFHWPTGSKWVVGTFAGVSILMSGMVRLLAPTQREKPSLIQFAGWRSRRRSLRSVLRASVPDREDG
jgi:uncharacterized membrane protein HdeD (DUF308 family)